LPVDGGGRHRLGQSGGERDEAGGVCPLRRVADDQFVDRLRPEAAILEHGADEGRAQLLDAPVPVQASDAADGGAAGRDDIRGLR